MGARIVSFFRTYEGYLPLILLLATSFFLSTAGHRIVFYLLVPFIFYFLYTRRADWPAYLQTLSFAALAGYLGYFCFSLLWSDGPSLVEPYRVIRNAACVFVFTALLAFIASKPLPWDIRRITLWFGGAVVCMAALSLVFFILDGDTFARHRLHGLGRYTNPNHLAFLFSVTLFFLACLPIKADETHKRLTRAVIMAALVLFILLTGSRAAYVGLGACVLMLFAFGRVRLAAGFTAMAALCLLAGILLADLSVAALIERADGFRLAIWQAALHEVQSAPIIGHGIAVEPSFTTLNKNGTGWESTHNAYLGHLYLGGMIGAALYLVLLATMATQIWHAYRTDKSALVPRFAGLTLCFGASISLFTFDHHINHMNIDWLVIWIPFALAWSLEARRRSGLRLDQVG
jgi:O-antigen ligase